MVSILSLSISSISHSLLQGTFSDFWKGEEDKNFPRLDGPFLDKKMWSRVLQHSGFTGLDFFLDDYAGQSALTVLVATADNPDKLYSSPQPPELKELSIVTHLSILLMPATATVLMIL